MFIRHSCSLQGCPDWQTIYKVVYILFGYKIKPVQLEVNGTTGLAIRVRNTTITSQSSRIASLIACRDINAHGNPSKNPILDFISQQGILEERVGGCILSLVLDNMIIGVLGNIDRVGVVRVESLDFGNQVLVEKQLSDMRGVTTGNCLIGEFMCTNMRNNVDVRCATIIVTGEYRLELSDTVFVCLLNAAEEGLVEVRSIAGTAAVHVTLHAGVNTGRVAVPHIPVEILNRFTSLDIDELPVKDNRDAGFAISDVRADKLALYPERTDFALRGENADGVLGEELFFGGVRVHLEGGVVRDVDGGVVGARCEGLTTVELVLLGATGFDACADAAAFEAISALSEAAFGVDEEGSLFGVAHGADFVGTGVGGGKGSHAEHGHFGQGNELHGGQDRFQSLLLRRLEGCSLHETEAWPSLYPSLHYRAPRISIVTKPAVSDCQDHS